MRKEELNHVENWILHVFEQKRNENSVTMNCSVRAEPAKGHGYKETGGKDKDPYINTMAVLTGDTEWDPKDYTGKNVVVSGNIKIKQWVKEQDDGTEKTGIGFTIFVKKLDLMVWDEEYKTANGETDWNLQK